MAGWAGLNAWAEPMPTYSGEVPDVVMPELVEVELAPFPRKPARTVEASADLRSGASRATGTVVVHLTGTVAPDGPDRVALLDGETGAELAHRSLTEPVPADLTFDGIPVGAHWLVTHRESDSPRRRYATRVPVELEAAPGEPRVEVEFDVSTRRGVVLLELLEVPPERTWLPVTARLTRSADPQWAASPEVGARATFEPGSADVILEFGELGPGRYELECTGFEPLRPIVLELPENALIFAPGRPR